MITLNEFLINHKISNFDDNNYLLKPILTKIGNNYHFKKFEKVKIGEGNFFIYHDYYHSNRNHKCLHLATKKDMEMAIGNCIDDYEDFNETDIIASFDTLKEAVKYILKDKKYNRYYDSDNFLQDVMDGNITDEELLNDDYDENIIDIINNYANIDNLQDALTEYKKLI